jgi:urate oxidase
VKNTVYVYSKKSPYVLNPPAFALDLALHFVNKYDHISKAFIDIISHKWSRIKVGGKDHKWSFVRDGDEKGTVECMVDSSSGKENLSATLKCGLKDLLGAFILSLPLGQTNDSPQDVWVVFREVPQGRADHITW